MSAAASSTRPAGVTCAEFATGLVTDYMEHALPAERRDAVHDHVAGCAVCARLLEGMRRVVAAIRGTRDPLDTEARAAVLAGCRPALADLRAMGRRPDAAGDDAS